MNEKPAAYKGTQPYIFISYSHRDSDLVYPVIARLQQDGYRVWYDEGITPGTNWDVFISEHLDGCAVVLAFLSEAYVRSQNCRDELSLSRRKGKPMNLIYTDKVELTPGLRMRYGRLYSMQVRDAEDAAFYEKLYALDAMKPAEDR